MLNASMAAILLYGLHKDPFSHWTWWSGNAQAQATRQRAQPWSAQQRSHQSKASASKGRMQTTGRRLFGVHPDMAGNVCNDVVECNDIG